MTPVAAFLFKTEPSTYSFADLVREKRAVWDGVSNPVALKHLRTVAKGDTIVIYHTGDEKSAVGLARALSAGYPDPKDKAGKLVVVDLEPVRMLKTPVPLSAIREDAVLSKTDLVRIPRLSVVPLTPAELARFEKLGA